MKKFNLNKKNLITTIYLIITILTPIFGINAYLIPNRVSENNLWFDLSNVVLPSEMQARLDTSVQEIDLNRDIFSEELSEYLKARSFNDDKVKIIIMFDDAVAKLQRENIINSLLNNYAIIDNYDIISGVYLACDPEELISKVDQLEKVSSIKKIYKTKIYTLPLESPKTSALSSGSYPNWWIPAIGADSLAYDGTGIRVAIVDTGIYEHPDLNIVASQNFISGESSLYVDDVTGHGTHCAGIAGGNGTSSSGKYRGVATGVSLINAKAGSYAGLEDGDIISAIDWSVITQNADIISMSFGGGGPDPNEPLTQTITNTAKNYGAILVSSAGNSGPDYFTGGAPAAGSYIISVGATDSNNNLSSFSSWGPTYSYIGYPDVIAPGEDIISTEAPDSVISNEERYKGDFFDYPDDADYIPLSGTSMACPMVAGALAILKQAYPAMSVETARIALLEGATKLPNHNFLKYGAGIINVSKSLEFLNEIVSVYGSVNNISKLFPDELPLRPYDLLHFPGDYQSFNLTLLAGMGNTYDVNIPSNVNGLSVSLDKTFVTFSNAGVDFVTLDIKINKDAEPGVRTFNLNITSGSTLYDSIEVSVDVKLPEYRILMESYHGLNDWSPELTFHQMRFSEAMSYLSELNISMDYYAENWTPDYNKDTDNSILTEEKLAQYDLIVLQNPVLPYNPKEMNFLKEYFDNGGDILFLGTRYQDLCSENLNILFNKLQVDLQINEQNIAYQTWVGLGLILETESVTNLNSPEIFNGVDKFIWSYGNTFTSSGNADTIASADGQTVAASYDGTSQGKGRFVAFGDLHWMTDYFADPDYQQDHSQLLQNLMEYFLYQEDVSINIALNSEWTPNPQINISVFVKDQISDTPIASSTLDSDLSVTIRNGGFSDTIIMNSPFNGFSSNYSYILPNPANTPYEITANITIGSIEYSKTTKILYYDKIPQILSQFITSLATRNGFDSITINSQLDEAGYDVDAYIALYSYSLYNSKKTINKTLTNFNNVPPSTTYTKSFTPTSLDPASYVISYIIPKNISSNFYNPYSNRLQSRITNFNPSINMTGSTISMMGTEVSFDDTVGSAFQVTQGDTLSFKVDAYEIVSYEDPDMSNMRVSINLLIGSVTDDGYFIVIFPNVFPVSELTYHSASDTQRGSFIIPYNIQYSTIGGLKSISTVTDFDINTFEGYLAVIWITVDDSEGGTDDFVIYFLINPGSPPTDLLLGLIIAAIVIVSISIVTVLLLRRRKKARAAVVSQPQAEYYQEYKPYQYQEPVRPGYDRTSLQFCPYCGYKLTSIKQFCPNCGKPFKFKD